MKKTIAILLVLTMVLSMIPLSGVFAATATTLYLKPSSNWKQSNARFAIYYWSSTQAAQWKNMTATDDGYYEVTVPTGSGYQYIFCRMNPSASANNWTNKWNQTADLTLPADGSNCYTVKEGTWDKGGGTWSVYGSSGEGGSVTPPPASESKYYVASDFNNWSTSADGMTNNGDGTHSFTINLDAGNYAFKVTDGTWDNSWPADNFTFKVTEACDVTIKFIEASHAVSISGTHATEVTELTVNSVYVAGNGSGNWLAGKSWATNAAENKMTGSNGVYEISYQNVAAATGYKFKFAIDGAWTHSFGGTFSASGTSSTANYNGTDILFNLAEASDVTIQLDLSNYNHADKSGAKFTVTIDPIVPDVYTFTINGTAAEFTESNGTYTYTYVTTADGDVSIAALKNGEVATTHSRTDLLAGSTLTISYTPGSDIEVNVQAPAPAVYTFTINGQEFAATEDNGIFAHASKYITSAAGDVVVKFFKNGNEVNSKTESNVAAGSEVTATFDGTNVSVNIVPPAPVVNYYVAGIGGWAADQNLMTDNGDGTYSFTCEDMQSNTKYEFKVTNGAWPPSGQEWADNGSNFEFAVSQASDVVIRFNPSTGEVKIEGQYVTEYQPPVELDYFVVGSGSIFGSKTWADAATVADNKMEKQADGSYKKVYTVTTAGTIELKVYSPADNGWYGDNGNNFSINATEGMTITVTFANGTASVETAGGTQGGGTTPPATEDTYHLVGFGSIFTAEWNVDGGFLLTKGDDGKYTKIFENVAAGELGFKVVKNNTTWIPDGMGNETKVTAKQGATVTVIFNPADNTITATAVGGTDSEGEGEGEGTVTPPAADPVYRVAGTSSLCGSEWNGADDNNKMEKQADGTYKKVYTNVAAGTHGLKIVKDGNTWIPDGFDNEIKVTAKQGATVTVIFNPADNTITATATGGTDSEGEGEGEGTVTPPPATNDVYHVVGSGSIFAADWTIADADKMEKQSDGTYKKVYTGVAKGNLGIKVVKNNTTWIPDGFDNEIKAEVTTDNSTVTVTYNPSTGKIDVKINNKEAGSASGTPEGGNQGGSQGGTSTVKEITIYAKVPASWTAPKVWAWKGTQNVATGAWPGNLNMTKGANGWWSIKITSDIEGVLICNENGTEQTADVKVTTSGANIYITVGEKQADGKYAATSKFESVPSNGDETALFGMVVVMMTAVLGMGITVVSKKKFF